jgi:hypothetical protein
MTLPQGWPERLLSRPAVLAVSRQPRPPLTLDAVLAHAEAAIRISLARAQSDLAQAEAHLAHSLRTTFR